MIVHLPKTFSRVVAQDLAGVIQLYSVFPNRESTQASFNGRVDLAQNAIVDFEWQSPGDQDAQWVIDVFQSRDHLRGRTADRRAFYEAANNISAAAPLLVPSGRPDSIADSLRFAREAAEHLPAGSEVWATITVTRPGLTNPQVLMEMNQMHRGVSGVYVVVYDNAGFPAAWSPQELLEYLRLIGAQVLAGRTAIAAHADVRGLMASALGATHVGTGATNAMRQYAAPSGGGGAQPGQPPPATATYTSLPLIAPLHGDRAEAVLGTGLGLVESHVASLANCNLPGLHQAGAAWTAWKNPAGNANAIRGLISIRSIAAAEQALQASGAPADLMQTWLDNAAQLAQGIPAQAFQTAGLRTEVMERPEVFRNARTALGI